MSPVNVVLIGPPGSGKGTQAVRLAERYGIPHISTGEILRSAVRAGTKLGRQVADIMASGSLVSDELMTDLVRARLAEPDVARGFVLDGYPRTVGQAQALDEMMGRAPMIVILIDVPDAEIVRTETFPKGVHLDLASTFTAPAPFSALAVHDSDLKASCGSSQTCFAIRFTRLGTVEPEYAGTTKPAKVGFGFVLGTDLSGGGGDRRGVAIAFPSGVVKTILF